MIKAEKIVKNFGNFRAVDNVSLEIKKGEVVAFLGPNGSGKSTTMRMLTGFIKPDKGNVSIDGSDISEDPVASKKHIGYLPENGPLYPEMTVTEFLTFAAQIRGLSPAEARKAVNKALTICSLHDVAHQIIETLSKGYKQRTGLAQAVLHNPDYLILDEPSEGLDPNQKRQIIRFIKEISADKGILISTHALSEIHPICDRALIINKGRIVADGAPEELLKKDGSHKTLDELFASLTQDTPEEISKKPL